MNTEELIFAYKVRHALNEVAERLPEPTLEKLSSARRTALSRKKKPVFLQALALQAVFAAEGSQLNNRPLFWMARLGSILPLVVLIVGLIGIYGIYQFEQQRRIHETAEIDAAVLADELPLSAYLDHGFNAYLAKRGE